MNLTLKRPSIAAALAISIGLFMSVVPSRADPVADFYKGKVINMLVGVSAGGEYDFKMRLAARHLGRHIPGNPSVVPQNMTGATGLLMANYLYNVAPQDGTYIGLIQNGLPTYQALGMKGAQFDAAKFNWIGSMAPTVETMAVWHTAGISTIEDAKQKEVVAGAVGATGITTTFPRMLNEVLNTRFKIVGGYTGSGPLNLAMERGEVSARNNSWSSWKTSQNEWVESKKIIILVTAGPKPKDLVGVPALEQLVKNDDDRQVVALVAAGNNFGHPFATSPGTPPDRVAALRKAFQEMLRDPEFIKDAEAARSEIDPIPAEELQRVAATLAAAPEYVKERARKLLE
jgi:tripartite-type tricarboxylate transporter receptor subunit TctC